jgi:2-methylisocitrate lyase-like PEP mutase family enzyme
LPINGDFEDGYGRTGAEVAATVGAAAEAGLAGIGIEDSSGDPQDPIRGFDEAVDRIRHAAAAARGRIVLTGRCDNFVHGRPDLDDTVRRLTAFAEAGADVLYAPFLPDLPAVRTIVAAVAPRPVNVVVSPMDKKLSVAELQAAGVRRISLGGSLYRHAMQALEQAAAALATGDIAAATNTMSMARMSDLLSRANP